MSENTQEDDRTDGTSVAAVRVRLPGFIRDEEIGFGDVVSGVTYAFGLKPCAGCTARAAAMNRWVRFTR